MKEFMDEYGSLVIGAIAVVIIFITMISQFRGGSFAELITTLMHKTI